MRLVIIAGLIVGVSLAFQAAYVMHNANARVGLDSSATVGHLSAPGPAGS
jgi:hypothetical protein